MASIKRERIARKALESIRDTSFWCTIYEIGGEWREQDMMDLSAEEIRFLTVEIKISDAAGFLRQNRGDVHAENEIIRQILHFPDI